MALFLVIIFKWKTNSTFLHLFTVQKTILQIRNSNIFTESKYGLDSIPEFCAGRGRLDQLRDLASDVLQRKIPHLRHDEAVVFQTGPRGFPSTITAGSRRGGGQTLSIDSILEEVVRAACPLSPTPSLLPASTSVSAAVSASRPACPPCPAPKEIETSV